MRGLKILVIVMGAFILVGTAVLFTLVAQRLSRAGSGTAHPVAAAPPIEIPRGARIEAMTAATDRLILAIVLPDSARQLVVIDLSTGARLATIELRTAP